MNSREWAIALGVMVVMLLLGLMYVSGLHVIERGSVRLNQHMTEEFILGRKMEGHMESMKILPEGRGMVIRQEVLYADSPESLQTAIRCGSGGQQQQYPADPYARAMQALGIPGGARNGSYSMPDYHLAPNGQIVTPEEMARGVGLEEY